MNIEPVHCPSCLAIVEVSPEMDKATCEYCGTTSIIEHSEGHTTLRLTKEIEVLRRTLQDANAQTAQTVLASNESTQRELQYLRLNQELSSVDMRLANTQAEIRSLQREPDKKARKRNLSQIKNLQNSERDLTARRFEIQKAQKALYPSGTDSSIANARDESSVTGRGRISVSGCLAWSVLWLMLVSIITATLGQVLGEIGIFVGMILSTAIIVYLQRRRQRKMAATT